jgi:NADH-quinone oxidoreductase subunit C
MLTAKDIHEKLKAAFPESVTEFVEEKLDPYSVVEAGAVAKVAAYLKSDPDLAFNYLVCITACDEKEFLTTVYHLESVDLHDGRIRHSFCMKTKSVRATPTCASVSHVWGAANWHEREAFDMMGIVYEGHPDLKRILCDDAWQGFPLRKDYVFPKEYGGIDLT